MVLRFLVAAMSFVGSINAVAIQRISEENPCANKTDGFYETRDVFKYIWCINQRASPMSCGGDEIFDPCSNPSCVNPSNISIETICKCRSNGNILDPWDCHKFITCSNGHNYLFNCSSSGLIYDPSVDQCVQPGERECKEVKSTASSVVIQKPNEDNPCAKKEDGIYETRDVFKYMRCVSQHAVYESCENHIFDPCTKSCVDPSKVSIENMCRCRGNGNSMDPWDCHKYVTCSNGYHYLFNCSRPGLIYDPTVDRCVQPGKTECREVHTVDQCSKKADGIYTTRDAFQYMVCKNHRASFVSCGDNLFDPCTKKCVAPSKVSIDTMCKCRGNGNSMDPWDCHKYVTCSNGYHYLFNCSRPGLIYDPSLDRCVQPGKTECKQVKAASKAVEIKEPSAADPCYNKDDGTYETRDSFQYMVCKNKRASYASCGNNLFDPCTKKCVDPSKFSTDTMCRCRANGNSMDPWDCHKYITCSNGYHYLFNCSRPGLIYDPTVDRCVQPGKRECREVHTVDQCSKKADGIYETRNVFQYMVCKNHHASFVSCGDNLFDPCTKKCVAPSKVSIDTMCKCRANGNSMDPWDCHKYVTCSNGYHYLFNCSRPGLIYDPTVDRCVQPGKRECKQVKALMDVALQRKGSFLPCIKCIGWTTNPKADPRCRYGCDKWMTFPPTKAAPTTDPFPYPTTEPEQTEAQLENDDDTLLHEFEIGLMEYFEGLLPKRDGAH